MSTEDDAATRALDAKRVRLARLLAAKARTAEAAPLSSMQERLWFLDQLAPGNTAYNLAFSVRLRGPLHEAALGQALGEIVRRHDVLRTSFAAVDGVPTQVIAPPFDLPLRVIDLRDIPPEERAARAQVVRAQEIGEPFDLARGPLLRVLLLRLDAQEHDLVLGVHHIVFDGWSSGVLGQELAALYPACVAGRPSPLPPLPIQYADFVRWQQERLQGDILVEHLAYWRTALADAPQVLDLPTDRSRPAIQSGRGAAVPLTLPAALTGSLTILSRRAGATLFMTLCTAFAALLSRYSGQDDLLIGLPVAQRLRVETEPLIGFFANTVIVRATLTDDPTFLDALTRVRAAALGAYAHQETPFARVVEALRPERDLGRNPLFQVAFAWQNLLETPYGEDLAGLTLHPAPSPVTTTPYDLTLMLRQDGDALTGRLEYSTDLFDAATIARLADHYRTLIEGVVADPDQRLSALPLLTAAERAQLLVAWNDTQVAYPGAALLHDLVAAQAARTPTAVALVDGDQTLTFRALDQRANQLAQHLQRVGVAPEDVVGLCVERSLAMVVGLLGILKAGAAYLPLDPDYPPARLAFMLEDSRPSVLVTQERLRARLPAVQAHLVLLDGDAAALARAPVDAPAVPLTPDHLAYVIYTSGSTGPPKGVMITHRAICNRLLWMQETYRLTTDDRVLQKTPLSFDVSVWEVFWPLLSGARLVLARPEGQRDPAYLAAALTRHEITTLHFVPSLLQVFLDASGKAAWPRLRQVFCSGETLTLALQERFFARSAAALHNLYGPTEAAIDVTAWTCVRGDTRTFVPLGRPIANTRLYILDPRRQPVPRGVPGELHIGGVGVARGYRDRPDLTAERFRPDPFSAAPTARLYATGDRVRYHADGQIEFLGRLDQQVKVRGVRLEPGEVEDALLSDPAVREAAVLVREDQPGDPRLVAYVVPAGVEAPAPGALRVLLRERLPSYAMPSAIVVLAALPLAPSGKLDRAALPPPASVDAGRGGAGASEAAGAGGPAQGDAVERRMIALWERVLGVAPIGVADNFFDRGGHSLLAVRLGEEIAGEFGWRLPLGAFFEDGTVGSLASMIRAQHQGRSRTALVPLQPQGARPPLFCAHPADGSVAYYRLLAHALDPDQPVYGLQAEVRPATDEAPVRVEDLARGHVAQLRAVQPDGPYYVAGYSGGGLLAFEIAQQLRAQAQEVALLVLFDTFCPGEEAGASGAEEAPRQDGRGLRAQVRDHGRGLRAKVRYHGRVWSALTGREKVGYAGARVRGLGRRLGPLARRLRSVLPGDGRAVVAEARAAAWLPYRPRTYAGRVTLFRGQLTLAHDGGRADTRLGWERLAGGGLEVHDVPGDHFGVMLEPIIARHVAAELQACLTAAQHR